MNAKTRPDESLPAMSDTKHTPGPWQAGKSKYDHSVWACSGEMRICDMRGWGYLTGGGALDLPPEEAAAIQDANKALIIAAPDLLTALQGVLRVADRATDEFDAARAAIAKAIGEVQSVSGPAQPEFEGPDVDIDEEAEDPGDEDEDDADCGLMNSGSCSMAGSEYCDFECPNGR